MLNTKRKFQFAAAFAALLLLAGAMGCNGFFVDPTLTGITVTCPSCSSASAPNLSGVGSSAQLLATGNYDDGSSKTLTASVDWSSVTLRRWPWTTPATKARSRRKLPASPAECNYCDQWND